MTTMEKPLVTTRDVDDRKVEVLVGGQPVRTLYRTDKGILGGVEKSRLKQIESLVEDLNNRFFSSGDYTAIIPPINAVESVINKSSLVAEPTTANKIFDVMQSQALDKFIARQKSEAQDAASELGVRTNLETFQDRQGYGDIEELGGGNGFRLNLISSGPTFRTRELAEKYLEFFNALPNKNDLSSARLRKEKREHFLNNTYPEPEQTPEYQQQKEEALEAFRATQALRDYGGGPMSPELKKQQLIARTGAATNAFNKELLRDQDFLRQLWDMGVRSVLVGGVSANEQMPYFDEVRIDETPIEDAQGNRLLAVPSAGSGNSWADMVQRKRGNASLFANVFWGGRNQVGSATTGESIERYYDPSIGIGAIQEHSDFGQPERLGKPGAMDLMQVTGATRAQAEYAIRSATALGDFRNWGAILMSENPLQAAIAANNAARKKYSNVAMGFFINPETNTIETATTGSDQKKTTKLQDVASRMKVLAREGNFAVVTDPNDGRPEVYFIPPGTNMLGPRENLFRTEDFNEKIKTYGTGTEGLQGLRQKLSGMGQDWANSISAGIDRYLSEYGESQPTFDPQIDGQQYLLDIPAPYEEVIQNWSGDLPISEKNKLLRSDVIRYKDINTGEMKEAILPSIVKTDATRVDRLKQLMEIGAYPEFDIKRFENLPNYPEEFKEEFGREPTVEDFEAYGYGDTAQEAFDNIMGQDEADTTDATDTTDTTDQQTQDAFELPTVDETGRGTPTYGGGALEQPVVPPATDEGSQIPTTPAVPPATDQGSQTPTQPSVPATGQAPVSPTGTMTVPSATAGYSAVPQYNRPARPMQAGYNVNQLTATAPGNVQSPQGVYYQPYQSTQQGTTQGTQQGTTQEDEPYVNKEKRTEFDPVVKSLFMNEGGSVEDMQLDAMYRMASKFLGYNGPKTRKSLEAFSNSNPGVKAKMNSYSKAFGTAAAKGGLMRKAYQTGGLETSSVYAPTSVAPVGGALSTDDIAQMQQSAVSQTMQPVQAAPQMIQPVAQDFIPTTAGQTYVEAPYAEAATVPSSQLAQMPQATSAATMQAITAQPQVQQVTEGVQAAQGQLAPQAQIQAAQQQTTSVAGVEAAQGTAVLMDNPVQREIQQGELISGVADAQKAAAFNEQIQAAQATPTKQATVQGQLEGLMQQFEGGETPAWAAGAMRTATATMAARGLGASSIAGQAIVQAAMESALPIAQMDAQTVAQFEAQNLSNRQQRAMLAAQQRAQFMGMEFDQAFQARVANSARIGDIANMNFTAEQQVALENARAANTVNLQNLSNRQAKVMAEAAALSQLDSQNLNNRQQAAVQNAQNFLQIDMANLSNEQQTELFKAQQNIQALFTDQAAENAAEQFNASSENQTNQFFANLASQTSQFNAAQQNAVNQFNVNSINALREFNSEMQQQRDLFNAQNGLVVAQANAQWRQNIATLNSAAQNESNMAFAQVLNGMTANNINQIWQRERDLMSYAVQTANNNADRATEILKQKLANQATVSTAEANKTSALWEIGGSILSDIIFT